MALSDDELLDFELAGLNMDLAHVRRALANQGNVYRSQLVAARWFDGWRNQIHERGAGQHSAEFLAGFDVAPVGLKIGTLLGGIAPETAARVTRKTGGAGVAMQFETGQLDKR